MEHGPPSLVRTTEQLLDWEVADLIKKVNIISLDGANYIIPLYCNSASPSEAVTTDLIFLMSKKPTTA